MLFVLALVGCALAGLSSEQFVAEINSKANTWEATTDSWVARLPREEARGLLGVDMDAIKTSTLPRLTYGPQAALGLPHTFDSRESWPGCDTIKEIRDQAHCGSCWAFGAAETMSDRECVHNKKNVKISAQDILACSRGGWFDTSCGSCNGGNPGCAFDYWKSTGVVTVPCEPYDLPTPTNTSNLPTPACKSACVDSSIDYKADKHFGAKTYSVSGEQDMMTELVTNGPGEVAFTVYEDFMKYKGGIYQHVGGSQEGGHAVKLIGYGEENGVKYWLIANSWGTSWGEKGFFRILRGENHCGIENNFWTGIPK